MQRRCRACTRQNHGDTFNRSTYQEYIRTGEPLDLHITFGPSTQSPLGSNYCVWTTWSGSATRGHDRQLGLEVMNVGGRTDVVDHAALKGLQLRQESGGDGGSEALSIGPVAALAYKRPVASRCTYVEDRAEALGDLTACAMGRDEQVRSC